MNKLENWLNQQAYENYKTHYLSKEFKTIIISLMIVKLMTSVISIYSAYFYMTSLFAGFFNSLILNITLTLVTLLSIEFLTQYSLFKTAKFTLKKDWYKVAPVAALIILCFSISFYTTTNGLAQRKSELIDNTYTITSDRDVEIKKIEQDYGNRINEIKDNIKVLKNNTWRGKLSENYVNMINEYTVNIRALRDSLESVKESIYLKYNKILDNNILTVNEQADKYYIFASMVMAIQFIVNFFLMIFWRLIYQENNAEENLNDNVKIMQGELTKSIYRMINTQYNEVTAQLSRSYQQEEKKQDCIELIVQEPGPEKKENTKIGEAACENCGTEFEKKSYNQKYCCETCRIEAYEKRTGKSLGNLKNK